MVGGGVPLTRSPANNRYHIMVFLIRNYLKNLFLTFLTATLLALSFPNHSIYIFAWVGLVPWLVANNAKSPLWSFVLSLICGMIFFMGIFDWILEISGYTYLHHALLALYLGSYFGIFGLALSVISRRYGLAVSLVSAPFIWVSLEYLRSNMFFLALPWGLLSHSQHNNPITIQIASITGAYGISFLIVAVNSAIAAGILALNSRQNTPKTDNSYHGPSKRKLVVFASVALTLLVFDLVFGYLKLSTPLSGENIKISVVQGNIEQAKKWDKKYAGMIMETYTELSHRAAMDGPMLVVWPETATPKAINIDRSVYNHVKRVVRDTSTALLIGSSQQQKYGRKKSYKLKYTNSAFLIVPGKRKPEIQRYDKIRLLPFSEYLPMKKTVPWSFIQVPNFAGYAPGDKFNVFKLADFQFGVTICWENIFPELVRNFVKNGGQFIVNITNEARFGQTAAPYQFLSMSIMRAVENRVFVVRCANTGISCFIDPCGRVFDRVKDKDGRNIFVPGVLTRSIIPSSQKSFYTRYGNWLVWLSMFYSVILIVISFIRKRRFLTGDFKTLKIEGDL